MDKCIVLLQGNKSHKKSLGLFIHAVRQNCTYVLALMHYALAEINVQLPTQEWFELPIK